MSYIFTCVPKDAVTNEKLEMAINAAISEMAKELFDYELQIDFIQPNIIQLKAKLETDFIPLSLDECKQRFKWIFMNPETGKTYPEFWYVKSEDTKT